MARRTRRSLRLYVLALGAWVLILHPAAAESIDELFSDPAAGVVEADPPEAGQVLDLESLLGGPRTTVGGSVNLRGGLGLFLHHWPGEAVEAPGQILDALGYSVGYSLDTSAYVDARPNGYTRFYASVAAALDPASLALTGPSLGEMFVDYTYGEKISFRAGRFSVAWGDAGMAANPGDLVARAGGGVSLRAFAPLGDHGLTFLSYARSDLGGVSPRNLSYAVRLDSSFGSYANGLALHYRYAEPLATAWWGRRGFGLLSVGASLRADWDLVAAWEGSPVAPALNGYVNFSHEIGKAPIWRFGAEYYYDGLDPEVDRHVVSAGLALSNLLPKGWRPGLSVKHSIPDWSGQVALGFEGPFIPGFRATIGLSAPYGARGTYFRPDSEPALSLGMDMKLSFSY